MERQEIDHFKRKFTPLSKVQKLRERVRYERAADGTLENRLPPGFAETAVAALDELLDEEYDTSGDALERLLAIVRKQPSRPFI